MAKSLKDILQGVKSSKKVKNDLGGYKPKAGDEEKFAAKHDIEKHEDRVGNGDDVYNATNVKSSLEKEARHGRKNLKDSEKVYEEKKTCNMTEADTMCEVHGMSDCAKGGKKVLKEKEPVTEAWYSEKGGERTFHKGQREAMRHAREIGGKYGATHGAQGQKASKALGWDAREKEGTGLGLMSKADKNKAAQKQKAIKKSGPWGTRESVEEAALPAVPSGLPARIGRGLSTIKNKISDAIGPSATITTGLGGMALDSYFNKKDAEKDSSPKGRDSNIKTTNGYTGGNAIGGAKKRDPFEWDDGVRDSSIRTTDDVTGGNAKVTSAKDYDVEPPKKPKLSNSSYDAANRKIDRDLAGGTVSSSDDDDENTPYYGATGRIGGYTAKQRQKMYDSGTKIIPLVKDAEADKAEHERFTKSMNDPEGAFQKLNKSLKDKSIVDPVTGKTASSGKDFDRQAEMPPSYERRKKKDDDGYNSKLTDPAMDAIRRAAQMNKIWNDSKRSINETLSKKAPAGEWISDFIHSKDPRFEDKSKAKRKDMALAAYYKKQREHNEEAEIEEALKGKQHKIDKNKNGKIDAQDFKLLRKEEAELNERVSVEKKQHPWGKMMTVYHGSSHSFPLHPEHQEKISKLNDGERTSFRDETGSKVHASREGNNIHLQIGDTSMKTTVRRHHFTESLAVPLLGSMSGDKIGKTNLKKKEK